MKTVIDVDDDLLGRAAAELGTTTKKDTVNAALRFIAERRDRTQRILEQSGADGADSLLRLGVGTDVTDPEIMRQARR